MTLHEHIRTLYWPTLQVLWPALLAAAALAVSGGVLGVFVILRREALLALAMPQVVTLGAAAGLRLAWPALPPAVIVVALAMGLVSWSKKRGHDTLLLPALYVAGVCGSVLLVADLGNELIEVQNLFNGIDVAVAVRDAVVLAVVLAIVASVAALLWRRWLLVAQVPAAAEVVGVRPGLWNGLFLGLLATLLVPATNAVGSILVITLLFLPAATVLPWVKRVPPAMILAACAGLLALGIGLVVSVERNWPLTHSVGGVAVVCFLVSYLLAQIMRR